MWKETKWVIARVNSYGDVKEAYVAALMKQHLDGWDILCHDSPGSAQFYNDMLIKDFFNHFITNVDNTAAVVEEDVVTDKKQYAVKGEGAGFPQLNTSSQRNKIIARDIEKITKDTLKDLGVTENSAQGLGKIYNVQIL